MVPHGESEAPRNVTVGALRPHAAGRGPVLGLLNFLENSAFHHVAGVSAEIVGRKIVIGQVYDHDGDAEQHEDARSDATPFGSIACQRSICHLPFRSCHTSFTAITSSPGPYQDNQMA